MFDNCILWEGNITVSGYPRYWIKGKTYAAHRAVLEAKLMRPLTKGMMACHHCDSKNCINPSHLYEGTAIDNRRDADRRKRRPKSHNKPDTNLNRHMDEIIKDLLAGKTNIAIAQKYNVNDTEVSRLRKANNIKSGNKKGNKLTREQAKAIKKFYKDHPNPQRGTLAKLAQEYGVSKQSIMNIRRGKTFKWI